MTAVPDILSETPASQASSVAVSQTRTQRRWFTVWLRRLKRLLRRLAWAIQLGASAIVLVGVLAVLAAVPVLGLYVLGYLLAAEGRVARGERWRNVLPWIRYAPRVAAIAFGTSVVLLPVVVLSDVARDATLIDSAGATARTLRMLTWIAGVLAGVHLFLAYARGGSLTSYVRPVKNVRVAWRQWRIGRFRASLADRLGMAIAAFQIPSLFWLGARGLFVAMVWLLIPCVMLAASGPANGGHLLLKFGGVLLLSVVFPAVLISQGHFAARQRVLAGFSPVQSLRLFGRAPLAWLTAGIVTAVLAMPLFLFKIVAPPRDALWMLTPMFVAAMLPARLATGLAYRRAARRERRRNLLVIGLAMVGLFGVGFVYASTVYAAQFVNEHGRYAVFEQHAFSLPVPFVGDPR